MGPLDEMPRWWPNHESRNGWVRIHNASGPVVEAATASVMKVFALNRGYIDMLGPEQISGMVINSLLYDGWTLTPPGGLDERTDDERDSREGSS